MNPPDTKTVLIAGADGATQNKVANLKPGYWYSGIVDGNFDTTSSVQPKIVNDKGAVALPASAEIGQAAAPIFLAEGHFRFFATTPTLLLACTTVGANAALAVTITQEG